MKPIKIKRIGNKLSVFLANGKDVSSSHTPYGINSITLLCGICEAEGVTFYRNNGDGGNCNVNGEQVYVKDTYYTTVGDIKELITNVIAPIIENALTVNEEVELFS